nr:MAG TPA: hypothetical protein [Caudoviricetes sp.]
MSLIVKNAQMNILVFKTENGVVGVSRWLTD